MNKYEGGGSSSRRSRRVREKKAEETEETAGYMGQPRQTGTGPRNHNKNTCQWQAWRVDSGSSFVSAWSK